MRRGRFGLAAAFALALLLAASPAGDVRAAPAPPAANAPGDAHPGALTMPAQSGPTVGPIGGRLFTQSTTPPDGDSNDVAGVAIDDSTATVFAANGPAGTVTAFGELNGTLLNVVTVGNIAAGTFPAGVALDQSHHRLFVSVSTAYAGRHASGWLLVLNESTFAVESNFSFDSAPVAPFEPTYIAYDPPSDQVFVENQSWGYVGVVNLTTGLVGSFLTCPVSNCAYHGYGLIDVPRYHTLVVPTCALRIWFVNTSNDSTRALVAGPSGSLMAWAAYDSVNDTLWVENYTFTGPVGSFLRLNLTTLAIEQNVPGAPPRGTDLLYDPVTNVLVATNLNGSEEISTFDAANASRIANFSAGSTSAHPFFNEALDPVSGIAVASGVGNGTTVAFRIPSLAIVEVYPSFPAVQSSVAVDPATGLYYVSGTLPNTVRAASEATGAIVWTEPLPESSSPVALVTDPAGDRLFLADAGVPGIEVWNASTGALLPGWSLPQGSTPCALAFDPQSGSLFVGGTGPSEVAAFVAATGAGLGTLPLTGSTPCGLAIDPVNDTLLVLSTGSSSTLTVVNVTTLGPGVPWSVGSGGVSVSTDTAGIAYVLGDFGGGVSAYNGSTGAALGVVNMSAGPFAALVVDPADGLLFGSGSVNATVVVVATSNSTVVGALALPDPAGALAFDGPNGALVAPIRTSGEVTEALLVPVPSAPTSLVAYPGNGTVQLLWGAPLLSGPDPVTGYQVRLTSASPANATGQRDSPGTGLYAAGLTIGVLYTARVAAESAAGTGTTASVVQFTPAGVPYPPNGLTAGPETTGSAVLSWSAPSSDGGAAIQGYVVQYTRAGDSTWNTLYPGAVDTTTLSGLSPDTMYLAQVFANNSAGTGNPSLQILFSTAGAPTGGGSGPAPIPTWELVALSAGLAAAVAAGLVVLWRRGRRPREPGAPSPP